jgi:His/Glu/Gln/Arg/opine family amino acid ABC transporter permease subunit
VGYRFSFEFILGQLPALIGGIKLTLIVSAIGIVGGLVVGVVGGAVSAGRIPIGRRLVIGYVEAFRNTPLLVQIFFLYFALPDVGIKLDAFTVAWLSLVLWGAAYNAENFRAAFEAVPKGYHDGARALGLSELQTFAEVTFPIGIRIALPSLRNTAISVFKNSSFMVAIGFPELFDTAVGIIAVTFRVFEMFLVLGVVYLALVWIISSAMAHLESRVALPVGAH